MLYRTIQNIILYFFFLSLILNFSCMDVGPVTSEIDGDETKCPAGQWADDTDGYYAYTHDCNPYEGNHFTVYSDGSSQESKQLLAELAEDIFSGLVNSFKIHDIQADLNFTRGYTYYIYAEKYIPRPLAMGYRNGFYVAAIDCAVISDPYHRNPSFYNYLLRHELTHVFQFTLTGCPGNSECPDWLSVWFREGQAIYIGSHPTGIIIESLRDYRNWISVPGRINPIDIYRWTDFPDSDEGGHYYPMFGLAYSYLVDTTYGHGATMDDIRNMFQYMKEGMSSEKAFNAALGISVEWYKENFYSLMEEYLSKLEKNRGGITNEKN